MTQPLVRFLIGGVQKGGTSALARYLSTHPLVRMPAQKEAHLFDAPDFDERSSVAAINDRYREHFQETVDFEAGIAGDATPIYLFHPRLVRRIARYNPAMRWIVLLRDPIDRAISQYHMESGRGTESWPLWAAMLFERWRLRGHWDDLSADSPLRIHSYRARGDYARQLDVLYAHFAPDQVLLVKTSDLRDDPRRCMSTIYRFLDLPGPERNPTFEPVFQGQYVPAPRRSPIRYLLRWLMRREIRDMRTRHGVHFD